MSAHVQNFRRQILSRATERVGLVTRLEELSEAKIRQADIPIIVHQYIFGLQVSMNDVSLMQITESKHYLRSDKFHSRFHEATHFVDIIINIASWKILKEKVDLKFVLEDKVH